MASTVPSGNVDIKTATISAENQFTPWVHLNMRRLPNVFSAFIIDNSTTFSATWTIQARPVLEDGTNGPTIDLYTSAAASAGGVQTAELAGTWEVRIGVKTGNFTAGTATAGVNY